MGRRISQTGPDNPRLFRCMNMGLFGGPWNSLESPWIRLGFLWFSSSESGFLNGLRRIQIKKNSPVDSPFRVVKSQDGAGDWFAVEAALTTHGSRLPVLRRIVDF
jgi:hypothetical protein